MNGAGEILMLPIQRKATRRMIASQKHTPDDPGWAWAAFEPSAHSPGTWRRVAHLHRRAGFAAPWPVLQRDLREGPAASIDRLLKGEPKAATAARPPSSNRPSTPWPPSSHPPADLDPDSGDLAVPDDLHAPSAARADDPVLAQPLRHLERQGPEPRRSCSARTTLLRAHALGDFRALVTAIGKDPAMLIWLDSTINRKAKPNENYAREVMELFTLGRGHYTEKDIQEAARAFTGWFVVRDQFEEVPRQHDDGLKTVLGQHRQLARATTSRRSCSSSPRAPSSSAASCSATSSARRRRPPTRCSPRWPQAFRDSGYQIEKPVEMILRSNLFFDPSVRRRRVKCPVEFAVGTIRALEILKPDGADRGPGRSLRPDGPEPVCAAERRRLGRRAGLDQLDRDARPGQPGAWDCSPIRTTRSAGGCNPWTLAGQHGFNRRESAAGFLSICWLKTRSSPGPGSRSRRRRSQERERRRRRCAKSSA